MSEADKPIKRKLIEVALPLEAINRACKAEKDRKVGKPQQIHHWWARRPIVAARAVLFAQLVDDPSSNPDRFPTEKDQIVERRRLFDLVEQLVVWESATDDGLLRQAHAEIAASFDGKPPLILDPFAGGGSIPLEAQRLGLEAHASDLNPVAVLINKALIEIPPEWPARSPVFPGAVDARLGEWPHATGLAEDVRRYGQWILSEAGRLIGHLYPAATLPDGSHAPPIAWIWARTVTCPNPGCAIQLPLASTWWLSKKKGKEAYVVPHVTSKGVTFSVGVQPAGAPTKENDGTVTRSGAVCIGCGALASLPYVREQGRKGKLGTQLLAVVAEGSRRRIYLPPTPEQELAAVVPIPEGAPDTEIPFNPRYLTPTNYGMTRHADLFTPRQLMALITISDLVPAARQRIKRDAQVAGMNPVEAAKYADAISTYLALAASRLSDWSNALCRWESVGQVSQQLFGRQAISMVWDYSEAFVLGKSSGSWAACIESVARSIDRLSGKVPCAVEQGDARSVITKEAPVIATDPPYYDNIGYADLADFFYIWLRRALVGLYPDLLGTVLTPKADELVADPVRQGGKENASSFFEDGFVEVFSRLRTIASIESPMTLFYAFKQSETDSNGTASTGWEVLLESLMRAGWEVRATWPMRTEMASRMRGIASNALASSVVLACRPRNPKASATSRRAFLSELKAMFPTALRSLQQGSVAPVDLAQAAIGPGMEVFTRHSRVIDLDGSEMTIRSALAEINSVLDEVLVEQEGDFDADTRFCIKWFSQFGWREAESGTADTLSRATNTSVVGLERGGVFRARAGKARLVRPDELSTTWDPSTDDRVSVWEVVVRLAQTLEANGGVEASRLMTQAGRRVDLDTAKELAYLLFSICEKRGMTEAALLFNGLGTSWSDLSAAARIGGTLTPPPAQGELDLEMDGE